MTDRTPSHDTDLEHRVALLEETLAQVGVAASGPSRHLTPEDARGRTSADRSPAMATTARELAFAASTHGALAGLSAGERYSELLRLLRDHLPAEARHLVTVLDESVGERLSDQEDLHEGQLESLRRLFAGLAAAAASASRSADAMVPSRV